MILPAKTLYDMWRKTVLRHAIPWEELTIDEKRRWLDFALTVRAYAEQQVPQ